MFSAPTRGLLADAGDEAQTKGPDQWKLINYMEIKLIDNDVEGAETIFHLNTEFAEKWSSDPTHVIAPRIYCPTLPAAIWTANPNLYT